MSQTSMSFRQRKLKFTKRLSLVIASSIILTTTPASAGEYLNGIKWKEPGVVTPGKTDSAAPSDAIILFDGKSLKDWKNGERWEVKDGVAYSGKGKIVSNQVFGDCQLHLEWTAPVPVKGNGQGRGNSGIFLMDRYEIQVLDSYDNPTYFDGQAGAIYKQTPPAVNAMRPRENGTPMTFSGLHHASTMMANLPVCESDLSATQELTQEWERCSQR